MGLIVSMLFITGLSAQVLVYVDANGTPATENGSSWANAYKDLQTAIAASYPGYKILVAEGTYFPTSGTDRTISFELKNGVEMIGGFQNGDPITASDPEGHPTILSGNIGTAALTDNSYHVIKSTNVSSSTSINGFTVTGGYANGTFDESGGAWFNKCSSLSAPKAFNCKFVGNQSNKNGGGIYNDGYQGECNVYYEKCEFSGNISGSQSAGGGIFNQGHLGKCATEFRKCEFSGNMAEVSGGAMFNNGQAGSANSILRNCIIKSHVLPTSASNISYGGAFYNMGKDNGSANMTLINCLLRDNRSYAGACMYNLADENGMANPSIINCTFVNNTTFQSAPCCYANAGSGTSEANIKNCIFSGNSSDENLGNLFKTINGTINLSDAIVDFPNCADLFTGTGMNNCLSGVQFSTDPQFESGSYVPGTGSPAINAGINGFNFLTTDLACNPRIQQEIIDLGAYETGTQALPVELISFSGRRIEQSIVLSWSTSTETDNDFFELERSRDGSRFESIAILSGAGTTLNQQDYSYRDNEPFLGKNYYRLKQVDYSQEYSYSRIITIELEAPSVFIFPNPVVDNFNVNIKVAKAQEATYKIYNFFGMEMQTGIITVDPFTPSYPLTLNKELGTGSYFIQIDLPFQKNQSFKFIKGN